MGTASDDLAELFDAANGDAVDYVLGPASEHWDVPTPEEGWPVGVTARHIALGHRLMVGWLAALRAGASIPSTGSIDEQNAEVASHGVVATPVEVADLLLEDGAVVTAALRNLDDGDLARDVDFGGMQMPGLRVAQAAERHVRTHLASIKAACS